MFVCRSMQNNVGQILAEDPIHLGTVADVTHELDEIEIRRLCAELAMDFKYGIFVLVKQQNTTDRKPRDLARYFGTYRSACTRNEDGTVAECFDNLGPLLMVMGVFCQDKLGFRPSSYTNVTTDDVGCRG